MRYAALSLPRVKVRYELTDLTKIVGLMLVPFYISRYYWNVSVQIQFSRPIEWNENHRESQLSSNTTTTFCCGLWKIMAYDCHITMVCLFIFYIYKIIICYKQNSSVYWFTPFYVQIRLHIWTRRKISRPLYYYFIMIHTDLRHDYSDQCLNDLN